LSEIRSIRNEKSFDDFFILQEEEKKCLYRTMSVAACPHLEAKQLDNNLNRAIGHQERSKMIRKAMIIPLSSKEAKHAFMSLLSWETGRRKFL
jgi:hypothetical protein